MRGGEIIHKLTPVCAYTQVGSILSDLEALENLMRHVEHEDAMSWWASLKAARAALEHVREGLGEMEVDDDVRETAARVRAELNKICESEECGDF